MSAKKRATQRTKEEILKDLSSLKFPRTYQGVLKAKKQQQKLCRELGEVDPEYAQAFCSSVPSDITLVRVRGQKAW